MSLLDTMLILCACATSIISGVMGLGGGLILISILAQFFPPLVVIPMHGIVQIASNLSRAISQRPHIDWRITSRFFIGAALGAGIGSQIVVALSEQWFKTLLGGFILLAMVMPRPREAQNFPLKWPVLGLINAIISMLVGANGPFLAVFFLRTNLNRHAIVATEAACQVIVHGAKIIVFSVIGFSLAEYSALTTGMVVASIAGSYIAKTMLQRISEQHFRLLFKVLVTALAIRLIVVAWL